MELGIYSFGDIHPNPVTGERVSPQQRMTDLLERARLADQVGLDYFGIGEHHRPDYAVSSVVPVLAAAAAQTSTIRVGSAVTVLSTEDPVRVYQQFATLDLLSGGRAELTAGRGSFIESYPLFGAALGDYEELYEEKIRLLLQLDDAERITWRGKFRPALDDALILPRPVSGHLDIWIATGGTPASSVRAARLGTPVIYALLGGAVGNFAQHAQLYRETAAQAGHDPATLKVGLSGVGMVLRKDARATFKPYWLDTMKRISSERGFPMPSEVTYNMQAARSGAIFVGNAEEVAEKIVLAHSQMGHDRHILQLDWSSVPQAQVLESIELLGTEVLPLVRRELGIAGS
ncbi:MULTISPECIES: LLM class flavin-dependent oxidoreductase [unclassified Arthrobacter]|uniref:LLM class flavin-dependent oxidoreductase n=1 Tax=unclassified Arthrobacter TaxID=235627 RepID=UPI001490E50F|nr:MULTISPECIES: LLM class flavin-dependent oxidoreductase [unclassified Arthrobacter]MBE0010777.1 LLM class flavin-dependent oxidoreductase [Arthrobacter sp. AET 35A]NOJ64541.1 LLM class flavin-dependent oxidoreductase [Arthrobacter sp. 147(2020)]